MREVYANARADEEKDERRGGRVKIQRTLRVGMALADV